MEEWKLLSSTLAPPPSDKIGQFRRTQKKFHNFAFLSKVVDHEDLTLVFNLEETLLKSTSLFPYFMLVAFEGVGFLRALILLLFYPLICLVGDEMGLKVMVFISFFGIKRDTFRIGTSVLPKFFLEDVGYEGFQVVMRFGRKMGVTNLPMVMVESFLKDYMGVEHIVGRQIKEFGGYYLGVFDNENYKVGENKDHVFSSVHSHVVGVATSFKSFQTYPFTYCKDKYMVSMEEKKKWQNLPKEKYPKPMIFHDGRLALKPTPLATLAMFIWFPFGLILCISRILIGILLPYNISTPILAFIGVSYSYTNSNTNPIPMSPCSNGLVFVCNHRTALDPVYISYICRAHLTALTYSISKVTEFLAPIKTITLTRDRQKDAKIMQKVLSKGNVVVCPEGTTCREPYLLRFSPLFAEYSDDIVPVAIEAMVSMFYGTTASGVKAFDSFFFMINPWPYYHVNFLDKLPRVWTCKGGGLSKFDVANHVQAQIGRALGYQCTLLTRKDKYLVLAGNTGVVRNFN